MPLSADNAFGDSAVDVTDGSSAVVEQSDDAADDEEAAAEVGTRENPAPIGSTIEGDDWTVVINSVTPAATDQILAGNQFNEAPDAGTEYVLINYTVTYTGDDAEGQMPAFVGIDYVTAAGVTVNSLDKFIMAPDALDTTSVLYADATATAIGSCPARGVGSSPSDFAPHPSFPPLPIAVPHHAEDGRTATR